MRFFIFLSRLTLSLNWRGFELICCHRACCCVSNPTIERTMKRALFVTMVHRSSSCMAWSDRTISRLSESYVSSSSSMFFFLSLCSAFSLDRVLLIFVIFFSFSSFAYVYVPGDVLEYARCTGYTQFVYYTGGNTGYTVCVCARMRVGAASSQIGIFPVKISLFCYGSCNMC